jgi:hypothetical protein
MVVSFEEFDQDPETKRPTETDRTLLTKLNAWVLERMRTVPPRITEAKARRDIVKEIRRDLNSSAPPNQAEISRAIAGLHLEPKSEERVDSITEKPFKTTLRREPTSWVAEETLPDRTVISQARISDNGSTELTLHFSDPRYVKQNANPNLTVDTRFPRATLKTFSLLVNTFKN